MSALPKNIDFVLPDWRSRDRQKHRQLAEGFRALTSGTGFKDRRTQDSVDRLRQAASSGPDSIAAKLTCAADIRAYAHFLSSSDLPESPVFSRRIAAQIKRHRPRMTTLVLREMVRAFLNNFEKIRSEAGFPPFHRYLAKELVGMNDSLKDRDLQNLGRVSNQLLSPEGPALAAKAAIRREADLSELLDQVGFASFRETTYVQVARSLYVVQTISNLQVGADAPILHELRRPDFCEAYAGQGNLVGHLALAELIDRTEGAPSKAWMTAILGVAGDPRIARSSPRFSKWWSKLGEERVQKARGWLSVLDVKLFLDVIQDYGKSRNDGELLRMYPDRKRFLQGLVAQGLVRDTRLFLSKPASKYVADSFEEAEVPSFATVADSQNRSMIYMQLDKIVLMEGSHNRTLYIMPRLPKKSRVLNYSISNFSDFELGRGLADQFMSERGGRSKQLFAIKHNGSWYFKAILALRELGLNFDVEPLLSADAYKQFRREHRV